MAMLFLTACSGEDASIISLGIRVAADAALGGVAPEHVAYQFYLQPTVEGEAQTVMVDAAAVTVTTDSPTASQR